ncbi:MAG: AzlC family ABC transporter permease [Pseudomonadota bacterium]
MSSATEKSTYWRGVRAALPFCLIVVPFGMLFGVVGVEAGLNVLEIMAMTTLVIAGASQFAALQLMTENAPILIVLASALAVNLRMAMYSASLAPYLGPAPFWTRVFIAYMNVDQTYALAIQEYENRPQNSLAQRVAFFLGAGTPILPMWIGATYLGAIIGTAIPPEFGLDFALPIAFIAIIGPALRTLAHVAAAITAITTAILLAGLPWNLWLLIAGAVGMAVGAEVERQMAKRTEARTQP